MIGECLERPASEVRLQTGEYGKPFCADSDGAEPLQFNLSHSEGIVLLGISRSGRIGVDIEAVRSETDWRRLSRRFFAPGETVWLESLPEAEGRNTFFRLWTAKEAFLKAIGVGLTRRLSSVEIAPSDDGTLQLARIDGDAPEAARWHLQSLSPLPGFHAAIVTETSSYKSDIAFLQFRW